MLKKIVFGICLPLAILGAAALSFSGCGKSAPASDSAGKMKVVATTTMPGRSAGIKWKYPAS